MSKTRYGHGGPGGGDQDQPERKDDGWERRQGGDQSRKPGRRGEPSAPETDDAGGGPPRGTNTQGELAGIGEASDRSDARLPADEQPARESSTGVRERDMRGAGTDQPPRMGGPLGADAGEPHLPEGAQNADTRGSGAGGFDRGVDASRIGAVHQGAREEDAD